MCQVRERRLLHGVGEPSPPQCSDDGTFLPVQCKLINTTDMMVFDLLHTFNRSVTMLQWYAIHCSGVQFHHLLHLLDIETP